MRVCKNLVIKSSDMDISFVKEICDTGGESIKKCFQCGTCTATCAVSWNTTLKTRRLIRRTLLGLRDVLKSPDVWLCMGCFACYERCPRGVDIPNVLMVLKNRAVAHGYAPPEGYLKMLNSLLTLGLMQAPQDVVTLDFETLNRETLSLPKILGTKAPEKFVENLQKTDINRIMEKSAG